MTFRHIPAGKFLMGSAVGKADEKPVHPLRLTRGFYIQTTEVTQGHWNQIMAERPWLLNGSLPEAVVIGDNYPACYISFPDALAFLKKLSRCEGRQYRLPTEAEWEYACRGGTTTEYYWGDRFEGEFLWYVDNSGGRFHPVGSKKPNPLGLYDMLGNAWEWCADWWAADTYTTSAETDPSGPATGEYRVIRGGSFFAGAGNIRCSSRYRGIPDHRHEEDGFRVVLPENELIPSPSK